MCFPSTTGNRGSSPQCPTDSGTGNVVLSSLALQWLVRTIRSLLCPLSLHSIENRRACMDSIARQLNFQSHEDWYSMNNDSLCLLGRGALLWCFCFFFAVARGLMLVLRTAVAGRGLLAHYSYSLHSLLADTYPEFNWQVLTSSLRNNDSTEQFQQQQTLDAVDCCRCSRCAVVEVCDRATRILGQLRALPTRDGSLCVGE